MSQPPTSNYSGPVTAGVWNTAILTLFLPWPFVFLMVALFNKWLHKYILQPLSNATNVQTKTHNRKIEHILSPLHASSLALSTTLAVRYLAVAVSVAIHHSLVSGEIIH